MALENKRLILFQGDSITASGRVPGETDNLGEGYPLLISRALTALCPHLSLQFANRAVSRDRSCDILARWEADCIALCPDFLSILLGINDVWHHDFGKGLTPSETEENYRKILSRTREALGDIPILLLSPFLLPDHTTNMQREAVDAVISISEKLATEFGAHYIPLDALLAKAADAFPPLSLTKEGVHPTPQGHGIIAKHWLDKALPML